VARLKDNTSVRQRAFAYIDDHPDSTRADILKDLIDTYNISLVYAKTLYQSHRTEGKSNGKLTEVFEVRDHRDGLSVDPYMFKKHVSQPLAGTVTSESNAIKRYLRAIQVRAKLAKRL